MRKNKSFETGANVFLGQVIRLRLEWCKIKTMPKTQWLAEDEVGSSRIFPFICGHFLKNLTAASDLGISEKVLMECKMMINALHVMVATMMSPRDIPVEQLDAGIKVFLTCCDRFGRAVHGDDCVQFWVPKGNEISLLNVKKQVELMGPLRWCWEGSRERHIQTVKKIFCQCGKRLSVLRESCN